MSGRQVLTARKLKDELLFSPVLLKPPSLFGRHSSNPKFMRAAARGWRRRPMRDFRDYTNPDIFSARVDDLVRAIHRPNPQTSSASPSEVTRMFRDAPLAVQEPPLAPAFSLARHCRPAHDLIQSCIALECVLFCRGAGLSARAGSSSTGIDSFSICLLSPRNTTSSIPSYAHPSKPHLPRVNVTQRLMGLSAGCSGDRRPLLQSFLLEYYQGAGPISKAHQSLQKIRFSSVITTNYDRLLEDTFPEYVQDGLFTHFRSGAASGRSRRNAGSF